MEHIYVKKSWGSEEWIVNNDEYCGKLLFINNGKRCSYHYHVLKKETFYCQRGKVQIKYSLHDDVEKAECVYLHVGESFEVPRGLRHQMIALENSTLVEFSTQHFDEDSYRIIKGD